MVAEGKTEAEIRSYMTERYGDFVLYNPPLHMGTIVLWSLPFIGFIFVIALLYYLIKKEPQYREQINIIQRKLPLLRRLSCPYN